MESVTEDWSWSFQVLFSQGLDLTWSVAEDCAWNKTSVTLNRFNSELFQFGYFYTFTVYVHKFTLHQFDLNYWKSLGLEASISWNISCALTGTGRIGSRDRRMPTTCLGLLPVNRCTNCNISLNLISTKVTLTWICKVQHLWQCHITNVQGFHKSWWNLFYSTSCVCLTFNHCL